MWTQSLLTARQLTPASARLLVGNVFVTDLSVPWSQLESSLLRMWSESFDRMRNHPLIFLFGSFRFFYVFFFGNNSVPSRFSRVQLFATPWTVTCQSPLSMGFSRWDYWNRLWFPSRDLSDPGIEPVFLLSPALAGRFFTTNATWGPNFTELYNSHTI